MSLTGEFFETVDAQSSATFNAGGEILSESTVLNAEFVDTANEITEIIADSSSTVGSNTVQSILTKVITNSTDGVAILEDLTTKLLKDSGANEVIIDKTELEQDSGIGTAEKVVIGAVVVVVVLAIVALILRILGPRLRPKNDEEEHEEQKVAVENISSKLGGFTNFGADLGSQSSGLGSSPSQDWSQTTGSTPVSDWSEISSEGAKSDSHSASESQSSSDQSEASMSAKNRPKFQPKRGLISRDTLSVTSLPLYKEDDRISSRSSPGLLRRLHEEKMSVHSLEPIRFEQNYRENWDDLWDEFGSIPRGNLSHLSHPSESRLSLNSIGSMASSMTSLPPGKTTFPIPPRDLVRQMHMDKERRYPSNTKTAAIAKKEKHVRLSPPNDRKGDRKGEDNMERRGIETSDRKISH